MKKFILALDQGTTSSRAIIFDHYGLPVAAAQKKFTQIYPRPGWVEHNPEEIWSSQAGVASEVLAKAGLKSTDIAGIGITNQRETTVVWNRITGKPVHNAIVWQDRRTAEFCDRLKNEGKARTILYNIHTLNWDKDLLEIFGIPESMLPEVRSSSDIYGYTVGQFSSEIPVAGIAGDQQAALFGQMCIEPGMVKNTYGTGCFMMMNIGGNA